MSVEYVREAVTFDDCADQVARADAKKRNNRVRLSTYGSEPAREEQVWRQGGKRTNRWRAGKYSYAHGPYLC